MPSALDNAPRPTDTRVVGFLLIPDFSLMSYSAAVEPLRAANILSGRELYTWWHATPDHRPVAASNGISVLPTVAIGDMKNLPDLLLVCAGGNPATFSHRKTLAWLRQLGQRGTVIGGISGGPYILAKAGLLAGRRCTVHWEHVPAFQENFPETIVTNSLFEIDSDRITCSGGIAAFDMMVALIARAHGHNLATRLSEWFVHTQLREGGAIQRMSMQSRHRMGDKRIASTLQLMESHIAEPLSGETLARKAGISLRQLERRFRRHLGNTPHQHYLHVRLNRARGLLRETSLSVLEVALRTGFASASQFSRAYRQRFGRIPSRERLGLTSLSMSEDVLTGRRDAAPERAPRRRAGR